LAGHSQQSWTLDSGVAAYNTNRMKTRKEKPPPKELKILIQIMLDDGIQVHIFPDGMSTTQMQGQSETIMKHTTET